MGWSAWLSTPHTVLANEARHAYRVRGRLLASGSRSSSGAAASQRNLSRFRTTTTSVSNIWARTDPAISGWSAHRENAARLSLSPLRLSPTRRVQLAIARGVKGVAHDDPGRWWRESRRAGTWERDRSYAPPWRPGGPSPVPDCRGALWPARPRAGTEAQPLHELPTTHHATRTSHER